jgi:hypothetical protein
MAAKSNTNQIKEIEDIVDNIKNKHVPTEREKEVLLYKLNRQLTEDEHLHIFTEILQNLEKRIHSITDNGTLFDLNDLPPEAFWKMFYYAQLSIHDHDSRKISDKARQEDNEEKVKMAEKMKAELEKHQGDPNQCHIDVLASLTPYERLRISALSQCQYSTYAQADINDMNLALKDDKRMEKTIYSDTFQHRWKSDSSTAVEKSITIPKLKIKAISDKVVESQSVGDNLSDGDEDEDMMINGEGGENEDFLGEDESDIEINRLKTQLLKMPKLALKVNHLNYEEVEDD